MKSRLEISTGQLLSLAYAKKEVEKEPTDIPKTVTRQDRPCKVHKGTLGDKNWRTQGKQGSLLGGAELYGFPVLTKVFSL